MAIPQSRHPASGPRDHGGRRCRHARVDPVAPDLSRPTGSLPALPAALGQGFSLNGELLFAFAHGTTTRTDPGLGPPITARATVHADDHLITVEDLGLPDSLLWYLEGALPPSIGRLRALGRPGRQLRPPHPGAGRRQPAGSACNSILSSANARTPRTIPFLGMGTDSSDGQLSLVGDALEIDWDARRNRSLYQEMTKVMASISAAAGGKFTSSFLYRWPLRKILTAHPLGGCAMGDDPGASVVDDGGAVWSVPGLYVVDGSIMPTALAVNPSLTIAALAERAAERIPAHERCLPLTTLSLQPRRRSWPTPPLAGPIWSRGWSPSQTEDGLRLNLINIRGQREPDRGPVIVVHGAGVRANIFRAPVETTIVDTLVRRGYDVWLENWRASIDFEPNNWTLDQAARYDHPAAVRTVVAETGGDKVKAIIHCQGSTSFAMSACAGLVPQVDTIVSNAVSLHTVVPAWSKVKLRFAVPMVQRFLSFLNPGWGDDPPDSSTRCSPSWCKLVHHECDNTVCKQVSFTYGSGFPALWRHENLNPVTHEEFIPREFGHVPLTFFQQMAKCVRNGHLVAFEHLAGLPDDYVAQPPQTDARFVLFAGQRNLCFLPESQRRTYDWLSGFRPGYHALHVLPSFSHLDVFMGDAAAQSMFSLMMDDELEGKVTA